MLNAYETWVKECEGGDLFKMIQSLSGKLDFARSPKHYLIKLFDMVLDKAKANCDELIELTYQAIIASAVTNLVRCQTNLQVTIRNLGITATQNDLENCLKGWEESVLFFEQVCSKRASLQHTMSLGAKAPPKTHAAGPAGVRRANRSMDTSVIDPLLCAIPPVMPQVPTGVSQTDLQA